MEKQEFHGLFELVIRTIIKEQSRRKRETTTLPETELVPLDLSYLPYGVTTDSNTVRANSKQKESATNGDHWDLAAGGSDDMRCAATRC
jgi:hypothetical protein